MAQPYNPFKDLTVRAGDVDRSVNWYRNQVQTLQKLNRTVNTMMSGSSQLRSRLYPGGLYLFHYDAKHKDTLPYWDSMPLVFPFRMVQDGFYGLNLHYLPYGARFKLMGALMEVTHQTSDPKMRMQISWSILNSGAKFPGVGACVKHYLKDHVQSRFLDIPQEQWLAAGMMPIEQFQGANKEAVWRQSRKFI
jgi:hypothetical protein